ncbi:hypothetical protein A3Q56_07581, partial [Intoshia linei]
MSPMLTKKILFQRDTASDNHINKPSFKAFKPASVSKSIKKNNDKSELNKENILKNLQFCKRTNIKKKIESLETSIDFYQDVIKELIYEINIIYPNMTMTKIIKNMNIDPELIRFDIEFDDF